MARWERDWYPRAAAPRPVKSGIKARSRRGDFAASWWGRRWIALLESFDLGARLARGRSYARRGQVVDLAIEAGRVSASVQGSRPIPYAVTIGLKEIAAADWRRLGASLSANMALAAKLVAGEMPAAIEEAFAGAGLALFPARAADLHTSCSCPDWSNPCKHVAAVYYLLAEEFDRDPFLLFRLRGMSREAFAASLGAAPPRERNPGKAAPPPPRPAGEALPSDPARFWTAAALPDGIFGAVAAPAAPVPLARRLGGFPFWRGEEDFLETLARIARQADERGLRAFLGGQAYSEDRGG